MFTSRLVLPVLLLASAPAAAQLPQPVRAMVDAAIATGDADKVATVVEIAKTTNLADSAELDAMLAEFRSSQQEALALAQAQEEEALRQASLLARWSGEGQLGGFHTSGNTSSIGLSGGLSLEREGIDWTHKLRVEADYRRSNGRTSREQFLASYEPRYQVASSLFVFGLSQFERDRFQGYSARYSLSGGLGYKALDTQGLSLSFQAGPALRRTEFVDGTGQTNIAAMLGADFDWRLSKGIKLTNDTSATSEGGSEAMVFIEPDNVSLSVITGLEAKLNSSLSARLSYAVEYDSKPPIGAEQTDTLTRFTLVYGF